MEEADFYEKMLLIRNFEQMILNLFTENKLTGTTHTCIGQEAVAVAAMNNINPEDCVFSNHRCHGHFIAYSDKPELLLKEIMGSEEGVVAGRGGSQHINYKNFYTNGVQGGIVPNAVGIALAEKIKKTKSITMVFLGDGTLGQGVVYESMNMASLYSAPVLFVIEDNAYAMTTKVQNGVSGIIIKRPESFNIQSSEINSNDVLELDSAFKKAADYVRTESKPYCLVVHTYRLGPHSKGDDFRDEKELSEHKKDDPLLICERRLSPDVISNFKKKIEDRLNKILRESDNVREKIQTYDGKEKLNNPSCTASLLNMEKGVKCCISLRQGLDAILENEDVIILGEDIKDPYGGAFKVTKTLTEKHNEKVWNTPISEAGFTGIAIGMAMRGLKPVVDYMFGDFITLGFDQILNHGTKYNWMYNNNVHVPVLFRAPMGGGRGYGPTHSQSLEKYFIGIPNLRVLAMSPFLSGKELMQRIYNTIDSPTLLIENKKMYSKNLYVTENKRYKNFYVKENENLYPFLRFSYDFNICPDVVAITYGACIDFVLEAAEKLMMKDEIMLDVISLTQIAPIDFKSLSEFVGKPSCIITVEEGTYRNGWGAEIISLFAENNHNCKFKRIASNDSVIPTNIEQETTMLINVEKIYDAVKEIVK